jgi:hypothetical protein
LRDGDELDVVELACDVLLVLAATEDDEKVVLVEAAFVVVETPVVPVAEAVRPVNIPPKRMTVPIIAFIFI